MVRGGDWCGGGQVGEGAGEETCRGGRPVSETPEEAVQTEGHQSSEFSQNCFENIFQARLLINYLTVVQMKRSNSISSEKVEDMKQRKLFKKKVKNLMNVLRMTSSNKIAPVNNGREEEDLQVEVVLASKLSYLM